MPSGTCRIHGCWRRWRTRPVSMAHHHPAFALPNSQQSAAWAGEAQQANTSGGHGKNEDRRLQVLQGNAFSGGTQVLVSVLAECMKGEANGTSQKKALSLSFGTAGWGKSRRRRRRWLPGECFGGGTPIWPCTVLCAWNLTLACWRSTGRMRCAER